MAERNLFEVRLQHLPESKRNLRAWLGILGCFTSVERAVRRKMSHAFGTTLPRFDVLTALNHFPDGLTMSDLARLLMVSNGNVTGVVRRLREEGFVKAQPLETDKRKQFVTLTRKGSTDWKKMGAVYEELINEVLGKLESHDLDELIDKLAKAQICIDESSALQEF